jgi:threonine dehydrogenase-like Zn-dependent dehydrogenase
MRALVYLGPNQLELEHRPAPTPREGEALIRIRYAGICGTDLHLWHGETSTGRCQYVQVGDVPIGPSQ